MVEKPRPAYDQTVTRSRKTHPEVFVDDRAGITASARASMALNPVPEMRLPTSTAWL